MPSRRPTGFLLTSALVCALRPDLVRAEKQRQRNENRCQRAERYTCCLQPSSRSRYKRNQVCRELGCNLKKCTKFALLESSESGDDEDVWEGDDHEDDWKSPTKSPTERPTAGPTESPVWKGDSHDKLWSGDAWDGDDHPTQSPTDSPVWKGDSWDSDGHQTGSNDWTIKVPRSDGHWSGDDWQGDGTSKCLQAERDACCNSQPSDRSWDRRQAMCKQLGCNLKKCVKRNGGDGDWDGDDHDGSGDDGDDYKKSDEWCAGYDGWNADGWDDDGHEHDDADGLYVAVKNLKEDIRDNLINKDEEREAIPQLLRLIFHDCVKGCNGCVDLSNPQNKGLGNIMRELQQFCDKHPNMSRADCWAIGATVAADEAATTDDRPEDLKFRLRYLGRKDCDDANPIGDGGPEVEMPSNHLSTHGVLDYFKEFFDFDAEETVVIMGVHSVAVAHRDLSGFGFLPEEVGMEDDEEVEFGWVPLADDYVLSNSYYHMLAGKGDDHPVFDVPNWTLMLAENEDEEIDDQYQWTVEHGEERLIMTNADVALVRDLKDDLHEDEEGNEGKSECAYRVDGSESSSSVGRRKLGSPRMCPLAEETLDWVIEYRDNNEKFLFKFALALEKMMENGC